MRRIYRTHEIIIGIIMILLITSAIPASASGDPPLDTIRIPASGQKDTGSSVESSIILEKDCEYRIVVSGTFQFRTNANWGWADAQYRMGKGNAYTQTFGSIEFNGEQASAAVSDVGNHTYTYYRTGDGEKIRFSIFDCLTKGKRGGYNDNSGTLTVRIYPVTTLSVTKLPSPHTIKEGDTTTVTVTVRNTGLDEIRDIRIADSIPSDFTLVSGETDAAYSLLKSNESRTLQYVIKPSQSGTFNLDPAEASYYDDSGKHIARSDAATLMVIPSAELQPTPPQNASVTLHGERTDVVLGDNILLKLSAVNLITKPVMHVQVIIIPPSGMSVASSGFVMSGGGQFTSTYEIEPGVGREIEVRIVANQIGDFTVEGRAIYYFGEDIENAEDYTLDLPIKVRSHAGAQPAASPASQQNNTGISGLPGWSVLSAVIGLLIAAVLIMRRRTDEHK